jgi:hypothetical protein
VKTIPIDQQRFYVGYYATHPTTNERGQVAVDKATDYPDACARADWYGARDPEHTYTVFLVVDLNAAALLDAHVAARGSAYDLTRQS